MTRIAAVTGFAAIALAVITADLAAQEPSGAGDISFDGATSGMRSRSRGAGPFRDFNEVTRGAEKVEGLFTLYKKGDHLYAELPMHQLNQPLLVPVTIARGMAQAGHPVGDDEMVLVFHRVGDRIQLVRRNIHYKAPAGTPLEQGGQAELHRLGPDGAADRRHQPDARRRGSDRLLRHLHDRLRPARPGHARPQPQ